jgi:hypothetical protein
MAVYPLFQAIARLHASVLHAAWTDSTSAPDSRRKVRTIFFIMTGFLPMAELEFSLAAYH